MTAHAQNRFASVFRASTPAAGVATAAGGLALAGLVFYAPAVVTAGAVALVFVAGAAWVRRADRARARAEETFRLAEEALRREREFVRLVLDTDPNLIFVKDAAGTFVRANKALADLYGTTPEAMVGRAAGGGLASPKEAAEFRRVEQEVLRTGRAVAVDEVNTRPDGRVFWFHTIKVPLALPDGTTHVLGISADITERKQLEGQFRQSQKMEAIGRLAAGVAHDFNNMLTVINGYSEITLAVLPPFDPLRDAIDQIRQAGERAALLTRQLLAFSRKQVLRPVTLSVNALLADMESMLRRLIGEDLDLTIRTAPGLWQVRADAGQLEQVVMNLCINARDAMANGGQLTVETANVVLDRSYVGLHPEAHAGDHVLLAVSDTGCGMDGPTRAQIFEPFFTTKGPDKGTGLGLATVFGIVKQSGGHVEVYSEPGLGSTFKVYLPRDRTGAPSGERRLEMQTVPGGTETVLLAEDEDGVRAFVTLVLQGKGYTVLEARHGAEALAICEGHEGPIDLLVTDVVMPNMSGRETAERLRAARPEMKVLYLSGYTDDAVVRHGVLEAESPFLQKPFSPNALARKVRAVLDVG